MSNLFSTQPLGELLVETKGGGTPLRTNAPFWGGSIPWASVKDFRDNEITLNGTQEYITPNGLRSSASNLIEPGVPIICTRMAVGRISVASVPTAINQDLKALYPKRGVDSRFLLRAIAFNQPVLEGLAIGSTVRGIGLSDLLKLAIGIPEDQNEQRRIAAILDILDDTIRHTRALIAKLRAARAGLLHDLQTRGLDEHGQLRSSAEEAPEQYRSHRLLGMVPRCWSIEPLASRAIHLTSGSRGWARYYSEDGALFLRIGNLNRGRIDFRLSNVIRVKPPRTEEALRTIVATGDVLVSITADLGMVAVVPPDFETAYINQHVALIRLDQEMMNPCWVGNYLTGRLGQQQFNLLDDSGAKAGLSLPAVASLVIPRPAIAEQTRIGEIISAQDIRLHVEEAELAKLEALKHGLMDDLLTGRVRVPITTEEVASDAVTE